MSLDDLLDASTDALMPDSSIVDKPSCQLLGPTALVVQALMGIFVILSLLYKRNREKPVRPWRIWLFDVSKQVVGQLFVHGLNVLISDVVSHYTAGNACVFYFLNILIDTTLGVALIYVIHHSLTTLLSERLHLKGFESGVYGDPPSYYCWMRQAAVYVSSLTTMKFLVLIILIFFPGSFKFGEWLLSWTRIGASDNFQVIFVMGIFPIIMNVLQFWFIDSIVKAHHNHVMLDPNIDIRTGDHEPLFGVPDDDDEDDPYVSHDIENPRPRSSTNSLTIVTDAPGNKSDMLEDLPADQKSFGSRSHQNHTDAHSYPPSLSSSIASTSTMSTLPKPAKNLLKHAGRRRSTVAPSIGPGHPESQLIQPQPRIPQIASAAKSLELEVRNPSIDNWPEWDESDDWAGGESRKNVITNSWDTTMPSRALNS